MNAETNTQRDELAEIIERGEHYYDTGSYYELSATDAAHAILAAGYRKPRTIGYIVVGRDDRMHRTQYDTRIAAQEVADEWTKDAKTTGVDWDYRVAEIVEAAE